MLLSQKPRGNRCSEAIKERRKRYRLNKKLIHRSEKEEWKVLAEESLKKRWHERCQDSHALHVTEVEERKKIEEEERLRLAELKEANTIQMARRHHVVDMTEHCYNTLTQKVNDNSDTAPLLLDAVVTPVSEPSCTFSPKSTLHTIHCEEQVQSARKERDRALSLARQYRDLAEARQAEKRTLKNELERKIETVRDFWRNKVVEGGSRSGQILRAALIKQ